MRVELVSLLAFGIAASGPVMSIANVAKIQPTIVNADPPRSDSELVNSFPDDFESEVLRFLRDRLPELASVYQTLEQGDPEEADEFFEYAIEIFERYQFLQEEYDQDLAESFLQIQRSEFQLDELADHYREPDLADETRSEIFEKVITLLEQTFEARLRLDRVQLEQLRREVEQYEDEIETRERDRREFLAEEIRERLGEVPELEERFFFEHEEGSEFEEGDEQPQSPKLRLEALQEERRELASDLASLRLEAEIAKLRADQIDRAITRQKKLVEVYDSYQLALKSGNQEILESRRHTYEEFVEKLDHEQARDEFQTQRQILAREIQRWRDDEQSARVKRLEAIAQTLDEILALLNEPDRSPDKFSEEDREACEEEFDRLLEQLSLQRELAERQVDLQWSEQRNEGERVESLRERIEELEVELEQLQKQRLLDDQLEASRTQPLDPALLPIVVTAQEVSLAQTQTFAENARPLLERSCLECHNGDLAEGGLNLKNLLTQQPLARNREIWLDVMSQIRNRSMPPDWGHPMADKQRRSVLAHLQRQIVDFDYHSVREPGYEPARRLTHDQYDRTLTDLFGLSEFQASAGFPEDLRGESGFANSAETLFVQPLLMESYLVAAEDVVRLALPKVTSTAQHRRTAELIFPARPGGNVSEPEAARIVLERFLLRAWRRPPTTEESRWVLDLFDQVRANSADFHEAITEVMPAILVSPKFLLHLEPSLHDDQKTQVDSYSLANRLSYFLWSSMPDERLFSLAEAGRLADPEVLQREVHRMLADPRARSQAEVFGGQWLGFDQHGVRNRPDPIDNPWATDSLIAAMKAETVEFVMSLIRDNQPITMLIDAPYTFLNEELARFYRIQGVQGSEMRQVALAGRDRVRGGVLGQGSILATTAFPGRSSPVVRGQYVLETLLGTPPPPPPPNVSQLDEEVEENDRLNFRQKLELHRSSPNCFACHSQMDPIGFGLESFDWFGRYRPQRGRRTIDDRGRMPDGTSFEGPQELKAILIDQRTDDLIRQVTVKMLTYALGRQLDYRDEANLRELIAHLRQQGDRWVSLIEAIVLSEPFRYRQLSSGTSPRTPLTLEPRS